jgi:membrane-associated phospholipid phosphatase
VPTPKTHSFPSGHASGAWALVELFIAIIQPAKEWQAYLRELAGHISENRESAGLHTSLDSEAGKQLGQSLGLWMATAAKNDKRYPNWASLVAQAQTGWKLPYGTYKVGKLLAAPIKGGKK